MEKAAPDTKLLIESRIVASNSLYSLVNVLLNYLFSFFLGIFIARLLGVASYGVYSLVTAFWGTALTISSFYIPSIIQYGVAKFSAKSEHRKIRWLVEKYLFDLVIANAIAMVVLFLIAPLVAQFYGIPQYAGLFQIIALGMVFYSIWNSFSVQFFVGLRKIKYTTFSNIAYYALRTVQVALLFLGIGLYGLLGLYDLIFFLSSLVSLYFIYNTVKGMPRGKVQLKKSELKELKNYGYFSYGSSLIGLVGGVFTILALGFFASSNSAYVGFYRVGQILSGMVSAPGIAVSGGAFFATITRLFQRRDFTRLYTLQKRLIRYTSLVTLPLVFGGIVAAPQIITFIYHSSFLGASWPLVILLSSVGISAVFSPITGVLSAIGKQKQMLYVTIVNALVNLVVVFVLIPQFLSIGAALAVLSTNIVSISLILLYVKKHMRIAIPYFALVRILSASSIMALIIYLLFSVFTGYYMIPIVLSFSLLVYVLAAFLLRVVSMKDVYFVLEVIGLRKALSKKE